MIAPKIPKNEVQRLQALIELDILDTEHEKEYDHITALASEICNTKVSLITMIDKDRQWFKSHHGLGIRETPRSISLCAHTINHDDIMVINDAKNHPDFKDNPAVTGPAQMVFYAGVPLITEDGYAIGTLCVADSEPKVLSETQKKLLKTLASQVYGLLDLRKQNKILSLQQEMMEVQNRELEQFAYVISHDIRSPLNSIYSLTEVLKLKYYEVLDKRGQMTVQFIHDSADQLKELVEGVLAYYRSEELLAYDKEEIQLDEFIKQIVQLLDHQEEISLKLVNTKRLIAANKVALKQILLNLISNANKYCDKEKPEVEISFSQDDRFMYFHVKDNGPGIPQDQFDNVFQVFTTLNNTDRFNKKGTGIGLSTVKKLCNKLGGAVSLSSDLNQGTTFMFSILK